MSNKNIAVSAPVIKSKVKPKKRLLPRGHHTRGVVPPAPSPVKVKAAPTKSQSNASEIADRIIFLALRLRARDMSVNEVAANLEYLAQRIRVRGQGHA